MKNKLAIFFKNIWGNLFSWVIMGLVNKRGPDNV